MKMVKPVINSKIRILLRRIMFAVLGQNPFVSFATITVFAGGKGNY
ncbi:hypothetical protein I600_1706 [Maribacter dokdonensis DSW-8]|nr:hypothetical protein I600_1706 [Maribacter dokdonensis DSW-8]